MKSALANASAAPPPSAPPGSNGRRRRRRRLTPLFFSKGRDGDLARAVGAVVGYLRGILLGISIFVPLGP
jgi:hypothetical protein